MYQQYELTLLFVCLEQFGNSLAEIMTLTLPLNIMWVTEKFPVSSFHRSFIQRPGGIVKWQLIPLKRILLICTRALYTKQNLAKDWLQRNTEPK